ncbi:MAG: hypothetical protein KIH62_002225 [Candidatus Kerfeldbacteria bacterium]|nr:hypothetical protein [Candidatus Kerfeldbacteria bacterium]
MRTTFSEDEIAELKKHPCVFDCTTKTVYYTVEFKQRALQLQKEGVHTKDIWRQSGFDVSKWKSEYFRGTLRDWRKAVERGGTEALQNHGGTPHDRGPTHTKDDTVKRLTLHVQYLEAENAFLARLRARRAESNSGLSKNTESSET